jgi:membrane-bound lytic murein transglycosylase D
VSAQISAPAPATLPPAPVPAVVTAPTKVAASVAVVQVPATVPGVTAATLAVSNPEAEIVAAAAAEEGTVVLAAATPLTPISDAMFGVADDGSVRALSEETLGHYADWLSLPTERLRRLNPRHAGALQLGNKVQLEFSAVPREDFLAKRIDFHNRVQAAFFDNARIVGTDTYTIKNGDTLWNIVRQFAGVPVWLLQQYNPDVDLVNLRAGAQLTVPRVSM